MEARRNRVLSRREVFGYRLWLAVSIPLAVVLLATHHTSFVIVPVAAWSTLLFARPHQRRQILGRDPSPDR